MPTCTNKKKDNELTAVEYLFSEDLLCKDSLHFTERTGLDGNLAGWQMGHNVHQWEHRGPGGRLPWRNWVMRQEKSTNECACEGFLATDCERGIQSCATSNRLLHLLRITRPGLSADKYSQLLHHSSLQESQQSFTENLQACCSETKKLWYIDVLIYWCILVCCLIFSSAHKGPLLSVLAWPLGGRYQDASFSLEPGVQGCAQVFCLMNLESRDTDLILGRGWHPLRKLYRPC